MKFGIDRLIEDRELRRPLAGQRVALLAHPASVTAAMRHSLDALAGLDGVRLTAAFGPQHGLRGDKQDNMVETADYTDPVHGIPVFSLYGTVRRPTAAMMDSFDVLLIDLQDSMGPGSPESGRPSGRGTHAAPRVGEFRRRRRAADASRPDARRTWAMVRENARS
jgi:uncharacterized protein YbbC (DUF1343 family)